MTIEKSELQTVKDLMEMFKASHDIADNILRGGEPCEVNIKFYTRQKNWSGEIYKRLKATHDILFGESMLERVIRNLGSATTVQKLAKVISELEEYKNEIMVRMSQEREKETKERLKRELERDKRDAEIRAVLQLDSLGRRKVARSRRR